MAELGGRVDLRGRQAQAAIGRTGVVGRQRLVAASPATVYRALKGAGRLDRWNRKPSSKGTGFDQPERPHQHWHIDITYINVSGTFYERVNRTLKADAIRPSSLDSAEEPGG